MRTFEPLHFLHGGDYNPDQWLDSPEILQQDIELMKKADINCVSLGIFAWAHLEPSEGVYEFDWMRRIIDSLYENGIYTVLATPSGAKPNWLAQKYEETRRITKDGSRLLPGGRHNHCYTSPIYREKMAQINRRLAQEFGAHPAVILWHLSNEYNGACYCPLCVDAFRSWLKDKYGTLEKLNHEWWTHFWSHTYTEWEQILPPMPGGETGVHGLNLDWKRFVTYQTTDFMDAEIAAIREADAETPVTTNLMGFYDGLNYNKMGAHLDIVSWDSYPLWHSEQEDALTVAVHTALSHDLMRGVKHEPFLLMESTPSMTNWQPVSHLKRPGMHMLSCMQAVAHGSNSIQYFQWRKSRGSFEKFHGAVVDHSCRDDTRVFLDVADVGQRLKGLAGLEKSVPKPEVALLYDWENRWAIEDSKGPRNTGMHYVETVAEHYRCFWEKGIDVDIVDMEDDLSGYKLVVAPMLYMYRAGIEEKLRAFVQQGGCLVGTYESGLVNENDLCYLGDVPGCGMTEVFGIRREEIDALHDHQQNSMRMCGDPQETYKLTELCERIHTQGAQVLAVYEEDFYAGMPVLTRNAFGQGTAYYLAAKAECGFLAKLYARLCAQLALTTPPVWELPDGVTAARRVGEKEYYFFQNFTKQEVCLTPTAALLDAESGEPLSSIRLEAFGAVIAEVARK